MLRHTQAGDSVGYFAPPPELGLGAEPIQRVSIFVSVFECHVNRAPVAGRVTKIDYRPSLFVNADLAKASANNERNGLVIEGGSLRAKPYLPRWAMARHNIAAASLTWRDACC